MSAATPRALSATALGTSAAFPGPNDACSGWLIQDQGINLLVDCGTGVVSNLQRFLAPEALTAIIITHLHADHFFGLVPLRYGFRYAFESRGGPVKLFLPPGGTEVIRRVVAPLAGDTNGDFFGDVFEVSEYRPGRPLQIAGVTAEFVATTHYVPCWAVSLNNGDTRITYTADTGPSAAVAELAKGSNLLISEATYLSPDEESPHQRGHLTAAEAGELAEYAGAGMTLLTHMWPHRDRNEALRLARTRYTGPMALAETGRFYEAEPASPDAPWRRYR
ncbi:MAG: MBL fold metallo-hydrolase [Dehalococcoidia bacterium]|nr:MBL fold metallo-hydrolase [Dehalococcoidia bacterium]